MAPGVGGTDTGLTTTGHTGQGRGTRSRVTVA